jgi:hypothetical protein
MQLNNEGRKKKESKMTHGCLACNRANAGVSREREREKRPYFGEEVMSSILDIDPHEEI